MSVKKEASGRRSVKVEVEVPGSTQSAAARRSAEAQVRALIAKFAPAHLRLIGAMRRSLRKCLPTAHEVVYEYRDWFVISYSPSEHGYEGVLAIRASADAVKLYFNQGKDSAGSCEIVAGIEPDALDSPGGRVHTRSSGGRAPDRRGHRSQSRAVRPRRSRVGGHSFGIGQEEASPRLTPPLP